MNLNYFTNIPFETNSPSVDQPNMKTNNNNIPTLIGVDHHQFSDNLGGYHTIVHQDTASRTRSGVGAIPAGFPGGISGINQVYTALYTPDSTGATADTQLFNTTGNGSPTSGISQLTGDNSQTDGYQWIGGTLILWGQVTFSGGASNHKTGTITFKDRSPGKNIPFPNNCWVVVPGLMIAASATATASNTIAIRDFNTGQFRYVYNSSSSSGSTDFPGFYWVAIGN